MKEDNKIITLSSDFEKQSQGAANMESVIYSINPNAKVIHLMHGIPHFDIFGAARTMEAVSHFPVGFHVCVVDPGVGTGRKGIILEAERGDFLIGPDNGCLMTAPQFLGGIKKIVEITNKDYMLNEVSDIFHGRDIFAPAAANLSLGKRIEDFGKELKKEELCKAPYEEAIVKDNAIEAVVIFVNSIGSIHLNIRDIEWDKLNIKEGEKAKISFNNTGIEVPFVKTFGDVNKGNPLIMKDDYNRVEMAINQGAFVNKYPIKLGNKIKIEKI